MKDDEINITITIYSIRLIDVSISYMSKKYYGQEIVEEDNHTCIYSLICDLVLRVAFLNGLMKKWEECEKLPNLIISTRNLFRESCIDMNNLSQLIYDAVAKEIHNERFKTRRTQKPSLTL